MLKGIKAYSSFAVKDLEEAKKFYGQTLGLEIADGEMGLRLKLAGGNDIFIYPKKDHTSATYTILNFAVDDIDKTVSELKDGGVAFEQYDFGDGAKTDDKDIMRGIAAGQGPDIAWFKDPSGNVISVLQEA